MKTAIKALFFALFALMLAACSTKRTYFEPATTDGKIGYNSNLPATITHTTRLGATLKNGSVITTNGDIRELGLKDGEYFLGEFDGLDLVANIDGSFRIISGDADGEDLYNGSVAGSLISGAIEGRLLAGLTSQNNIILIDLAQKTELLNYHTGASFAQDARTAAPIFLSTIIIYPTLDGKIMIVDKNRGVILRDAVVSSEPFFNNIIYLGVTGDKMLAATASKLVVISPETTKYYTGQIKDVLIYQNRIYILLKDGRVSVTDLSLNLLASTEFKNAIFSNIIALDGTIYLFEKTGYLISADPLLLATQILKLDGDIASRSFGAARAFFYDNKILKLK